MSNKLADIRQGLVSPTLGIPDEKLEENVIPSSVSADTLEFDDPSNEGPVIMNAVKDENGEMVATDVISAATVTARFRNVAERHGKVDLKFRISVPAKMQDSRWQIRLNPEMTVLGDTLSLDQVVLTGSEYRRTQLRGYQQYQRFLDSIITNDSLMVNISQLEIFIRRNIPQIYRFKTDSSYVSDSEFYSNFGLTENDAMEHYTNHLKLWVNNRKKSMISRKFSRYVKSPIIKEGLRLDTVIRNQSGDFIYDYTQTIDAVPGLRKAEITMNGGIYEQEIRMYTISKTDPITFYISSLSSLVDDSDHFLTRIVNRKLSANTACYVDFKVGSSKVEISLSHNAEEIGRIQNNLQDIVNDMDYDLDSIVITASASPEGSYVSNDALSMRRSKSVAAYFKNYLDSLSGFEMMIDSEQALGSNSVSHNIEFLSRNNPENWKMLDVLVEKDDSLSAEQKEFYFKLAEIRNPDIREKKMQEMDSYKYIRSVLYPRLRTVKFEFCLHRKGMVKDTVHTTVLDTAYMRGVQAIKDRDYKTALTILKPYSDYNTAVAYCSMDYNASALEILSRIPRSPEVLYMLAIIKSRLGYIAEAVELYRTACAENPSLVHRGNLDPEISELIRKYNLNN